MNENAQRREMGSNRERDLGTRSFKGMSVVTGSGTCIGYKAFSPSSSHCGACVFELLSRQLEVEGILEPFNFSFTNRPDELGGGGGKYAHPHSSNCLQMRFLQTSICASDCCPQWRTVLMQWGVPRQGLSRLRITVGK